MKDYGLYIFVVTNKIKMYFFYTGRFVLKTHIVPSFVAFWAPSAVLEFKLDSLVASIEDNRVKNF